MDSHMPKALLKKLKTFGTNALKLDYSQMSNQLISFSLCKFISWSKIKQANKTKLAGGKLVL